MRCQESFGHHVLRSHLLADGSSGRRNTRNSKSEQDIYEKADKRSGDEVLTNS
jgi:hypothetical protein